MGRTEARPSPAAWLGAAAILCGAYALAVWLAGGFDLRVASVRLRSHDWLRPALLGLASAVAAAWVSRKELVAAMEAVWPSVDSVGTARMVTAVAIAWTLAAAAACSTATAGGSDSYGYLSQAKLFAAGRLTDSVSLSDAPIAASALVPLAYAQGSRPGVIVPTYPPGLPLLMAPAALAAEGAVYLIVPALGLMVVWLTMRLGAALGDPLAGAVAALFVSISPIFLFQVFQPMSDVPATACWLGALMLASRGSRMSATAAGAVSSLAVLIRPNLLPAIPLVLAVTIFAGPGDRWRRALSCAAAGVPAALALGWIQEVRFGSPFASGYGAIGSLYALENIAPNLARYPRWLTACESPVIWLWLLAPLFVRHRPRPAFAWIALGFIAVIWLAYLPYFVFGPDEWFYTRFLLPALPIMMVFAALVGLRGIRALPAAWRIAAVVVPVVALAGYLVRATEARGAFTFFRDEQRYREAGAYVRNSLPAAAVVLAGQHSGSVRYYAGRQTVRWDLLDRGALDRTLEVLRARGFVPFAVVDADEDVEFRRIFSAAGQQSVRSLRPLAELGRARIYGFD